MRHGIRRLRPFHPRHRPSHRRRRPTRLRRRRRRPRLSPRRHLLILHLPLLQHLRPWLHLHLLARPTLTSLLLLLLLSSHRLRLFRPLPLTAGHRQLLQRGQCSQRRRSTPLSLEVELVREGAAVGLSPLLPLTRRRHRLRRQPAQAGEVSSPPLHLILPPPLLPHRHHRWQRLPQQQLPLRPPPHPHPRSSFLPTCLRSTPTLPLRTACTPSRALQRLLCWVLASSSLSTARSASVSSESCAGCSGRTRARPSSTTIR